MGKLDDYRKKIDKIDVQLLDLLSERFKIVEAVAGYKESKDIPLYDPKREQLLLNKIDTLSRKFNLDVQDMRKIFIDIMYASKRIQKESFPVIIDPYSKEKLKIGFQGELGAYSESAVHIAFPN